MPVKIGPKSSAAFDIAAHVFRAVKSVCPNSSGGPAARTWCPICPLAVVQALPHIQATPPATVINRLARTVVGLVTDVTLALSVTPGAPATGLTRVGVDVEAPGRSAELWRPADRCRRLHLVPWGPPQRAARLRRALAPPSVYPLKARSRPSTGSTATRRWCAGSRRAATSSCSCSTRTRSTSPTSSAR